MRDRLHYHSRRRRDLPDGRHLIVNAGVQRFEGQPGYFTVTGEVYGSKSVATRALRYHDVDFQEGGVLHDRILAAFPRLAPVVALHLSDETTGEPMHADANARYWYSIGHDPADDYGRMGTGFDTFARHTRLPREHVPESMGADQLSAFLVNLRPRWRYEARKARRILGARAPRG